MTDDSADKEVFVEYHITQLPGESAVSESAATFYFPNCSAECYVSKDLRVLPLKGTTGIIDLLMADDTIQVWGYWRDDVNQLYDGLTSKARVDLLYEIESLLTFTAYFTWTDGSTTETVQVMCQDFECDSTPGEGDLIQYNFNFTILDSSKSVEAPKPEESS